MKRVVGFFDTFDEIPDSGKYLYSRAVEINLGETEEEKNARIISNNPEAVASHKKAIFYVHYYELDHMDFEELMSTEFGKKTAVEKMNEFTKKYGMLPR
ncbi:MAG: hypothetical protein E6Q36_05630 [Chryseobacterium sp.]|nr:MAG: hypothetical protein E6Q36_05630 [Chryseobacterium sp.]